MYKIIGADQKEYGLISADQLRQWISEGRINAQTKVLPEGTTIWKTAGELPEFAAVFGIVAPAPHTAPISMPASPATPKVSQMAVWALVTGIISMCPCCWILGLLPVILGAIALSQIKQDPQKTGSGFAIAGLVLGIIAMILLAIFIIVSLAFPQFVSNLQTWLQQQQP